MVVVLVYQICGLQLLERFSMFQCCLGFFLKFLFHHICRIICNLFVFSCLFHCCLSFLFYPLLPYFRIMRFQICTLLLFPNFCRSLSFLLHFLSKLLIPILWSHRLRLDFRWLFMLLHINTSRLLWIRYGSTLAKFTCAIFYDLSYWAR